MSFLTYLYCVIAAPAPPRVARAPRGLPGLRAPRALEIDRGLYAIVADAPRRRYNEDAVNQGLADLDWVARAAVAHEAVVEHFFDARAVLPATLLTLFESDERAIAHLRRQRSRLKAAARRVGGQVEWGVRMLFDPARAPGSADPARGGVRLTGAAYLRAKRVRQHARNRLTATARQAAARTFARLARKARAARKRVRATPASAEGTLLLDAAFLVPRSRERVFRSMAAREAESLARDGYVLTLTGPWPPYSFVRN